MILIAAFVLFTAAVSVVDVRQIGPDGSSVGFASVNGFVHRLTGVNFFLYHLTDWLGLVPVAVCVGFGMLGLVQWIKRKSKKLVDGDLLLLGGFYAVTVALFLLFEFVVINYRPVLIDGRLEASYPSSTTLVVMCVMSTAFMQAKRRIENSFLKTAVRCTVVLFTVFCVAGRIISGVHWFTDILAGAILGAGLVLMYRYLAYERLCASAD